MAKIRIKPDPKKPRTLQEMRMGAPAPPHDPKIDLQEIQGWIKEQEEQRKKSIGKQMDKINIKIRKVQKPVDYGKKDI